MKNIRRQTLKYFWSHAKNFKLLFAGILVSFGIGVVINDILAPLLYKNIIDQISNFTGDRTLLLGSLLKTLFYIVGIFLFGEVIAWRMGGFLLIRLATKAMKRIFDDCFSKLQQHSFEFFANNFTGSLVSKAKRLVHAYDRIEDIILFDFFTNFIRLVASITLLFFFAPIFSFILIFWTLLYVWGNWAFALWKMKFDRHAASMETRTTAELADAITNSITIKMFARFAFECQKFFRATKAKLLADVKTWDFGEIANIFIGLSMIIVEFLMMFFAIKLWTEGTISAGTIILIQMVMIAILRNLWNFSRIIKDFYKSLADSEEMIEILYTSPEIKDLDHPEKCKISAGKIEFQNISFLYEGQTEVFNNFNLRIKPSEKIGIVGESGGGKSTFTKLLLRFSDVTKGKICIDGQDIRSLRQEDLREKISYVPQDPILFHRSLRENIRYGRLDATDAEIYAAARMANAHEFILNTPKKYETLVGERGVKLSGGERQRIAIARALLKNAPILILDEATSSLDSKSEKLIQEALEHLMKRRTVIVIAHRLSTIQKLDKIIVLENGEIIESGSHNELLKQKGKYAELWSHQAGGFLE